MRLNLASRARRAWLPWIALALCVPGCAEGPLLLELAVWNPYARKQWAEDERYGPTFYTRVEEIRASGAGASEMAGQEQQRLAGQLAGIALEDENPLLRREAVLALAAFATPVASAPLRQAVTDPDPLVRAAACRAWGRRGGQEAAHILAGVVGGDQDRDVRIAATRELGQFGDPAAVNALAVALEDSDPALQYRAMKSLKSATNQDFGNDVVAWRDYLQGGTPAPRSPSLVERLTNWF